MHSKKDIPTPQVLESEVLKEEKKKEDKKGKPPKQL